MNTAIMKNWSVASTPNGFTAPELLKPRLHGEIYEDSRKQFPDDSKITTSAIRKITDCETHKIVETDNTRYTVYPAEVDPEYENKYPGAYLRLQVA